MADILFRVELQQAHDIIGLDILSLRTLLNPAQSSLKILAIILKKISLLDEEADSDVIAIEK